MLKAWPARQLARLRERGLEGRHETGQDQHEGQADGRVQVLGRRRLLLREVGREEPGNGRRRADQVAGAAARVPRGHEDGHGVEDREGDGRAAEVSGERDEADEQQPRSDDRAP
jgi:hypothetical protein